MGALPFKLHFEELRIPSERFKKTAVSGIRWINITDLVNRSIVASKISEGTITIQVKHTTAGILLNEREEGLIESDLPTALEKLFPEGSYVHDREERLRKLPGEPRNGKSHLQNIIATAPSLTLILRNGTLQLGTWQTVLLYDFDSRNRPQRNLLVSIMGQPAS